MPIETVLQQLCVETIDSCNDWYLWRSINEKKLPDGILLPEEGNEYTKNVALKLALNKKWLAAEDDGKNEIIKYYISTWGGIHGNSQENIKRYSNSDPSTLISLGTNGVASWSKALCIYDPHKYAIFDARVSASLNALQILARSTNPKLFPVLTSRNKTIVKANSKFENMANEEAWPRINDNEYYSRYLSLLKDVKSKIHNVNAKIYTIEMLLFSKAEELVKKAFPDNRF